MANHHPFYNRRAWRDRLRAQVLHDADYRCRCGASLIGAGRDAHVHHRKTVKRAPALGLEPLNLIALCVACHTAEHNAEKYPHLATRSGCDEHGNPVSADHPWNAHRGDIQKCTM
jgi:5-methylcytosine-specific restriction endonuclease McrA